MKKLNCLTCIVALFSISLLSQIVSAQEAYRLVDNEIKPLLERIDDRARKFGDAIASGCYRRGQRMD